MGRSRSRVAVRGATTTAVPPAAPRSRVALCPAWGQHLGAIALIFLVLSLVFPEIAWQRQVFLAADYEAPSAFAAAGRRAMAAGEYPLWNPYLFLGMPSFSSLMFTPWVFPPSELLRALGRLPLVPPLGWLLFYFAAAAYGVFVLLRSWRCSFWPALLAGLAFMLTPHLVSMGVFGHGSKLASVAFLPWLLWAAMRLRRSSSRLAWIAILSALIGLQLLRGHPQIAFYGLMMLALFTMVEIGAAARAPAARRGALRFGAEMAGAVGLGFGLAAVLLLPVRGYAPESIRGRTTSGGASYEFATGWSQSPGEVATFALPSASGFGEATYVGSMPFTNFPHYLGQATLLFGACAFLFLRGRLLVFLALLLLLAVAVSFGKNAPLLYDLLYHHLPYFNKFRVPVMILVLFQLGASIAAGLGLAALLGETPLDLDSRRAATAKAMRALGIATAMAAALLLLGGLARSGAVAQDVALSPRLPAEARTAFAEVARGMVQRDSLRVAIVLLLQAGIVIAWTRRRLPADAAGALVIALAVFDLASVDRRMVHPERTWTGLESRVGPPRQATVEASPLVRYLREHPSDAPAPTRILPLGSMFNSNEWMTHEVASVGGYHPAKPTRMQTLLEAGDLLTSRGVLDLLAVRYLVAPEALDGGPAPVYAGADGHVYANPSSLPRAWVLGRWRRSEGANCVHALAEFDPRAEVLLESAPEPLPVADATGTARIVRFTANRVELEVESSAAALLVLSEAYHPHWRARVDGVTSPVLAANCLLRAVSVPAGKSHVAFEFVDPALRAGLATTSATAAILAALVVLAWWRWRRGMARVGSLPSAVEPKG